MARGASNQIVSRERVALHGEVYTAPREVAAMLDLVKDEAGRIDSRFLEPACGTGNFLTAIAALKLAAVSKRYKKSQSDWERYALLALGSIYGIDILKDNVTRARAILCEQFCAAYGARFKKRDSACVEAARFIAQKNIVWADALTMKLCGTGGDIVFCEWTLVGGLFKRRDFMFNNLAHGGAKRQAQRSLFGEKESKVRAVTSDGGDEGVIFIPEREYPLRPFSELAKDG